VSGAVYPPPHHVLRDLAFESERRHDHTIVRAEATPYLAHGGDHLGIGALAVLLDVSGAATAIGAVAPDWIATVDLTYHGRPVPLGPVLIDVAPVRIGRNLVVMGASVEAGATDPDPHRRRGRGLVTFARIPGSATELTVDDTPTDPVPLLAAEPLDEPIEDRLLVRIVDAGAGVLEMPHHDYARNSFGTINGGVVGLLCEAAARHCAAALLDATVQTHGIEIHFLEQTRSGPARTSTEIVRADDHGATIRVELNDVGAGGALLAIGIVGVVTSPPRS